MCIGIGYTLIKELKTLFWVQTLVSVLRHLLTNDTSIGPLNMFFFLFS